VVAWFGFKVSFVFAAFIIGLATTAFYFTETFEKKITCTVDEQLIGETSPINSIAKPPAMPGRMAKAML
jgi:hypothetical protein